MNFIINFLLSFLFGVRVEGEPVDLSFPKPTEELPPLDKGFFQWSKEFRVGCRAKDTSFSY